MPKDSSKTPTDYTSGSILRSIIMMGAPSMLGFMATHIYTMVDTWWVAQLPNSESAVAGLTIFSNIHWFVGSINVMIGAGSVAVISRRYGQKRLDLTERAIKDTFLLKLLVGVVFAILGMMYVRELVYLVGGRGQSLELGARYGLVMFSGMPAAFVAFSVWTALRSVGNPHTAMYIMFGSTAFNMILDPLLIFGYWGFPEMGIEGAALASVISYVLVVVTGLAIFLSGRANVRLRFFSGAPLKGRQMWDMVKIGIPSWAAGVSDSGVRLILTPLIALYGDKVLAAYGIGVQVVGLGIMLVVGAGLGLSALVGQTLGAGKRERTKKTGDTALMLSITMMTAFGILAYMLAPFFASLYFTDPETVEFTITALRIFAFGFPFWGAWILLEGLYSGVGMNKPTMVFSLIHAWILQAPLALFLVKYLQLGVASVWWGMIAVAAVTSVAFYFHYRRGAWLKAAI